MFEVGSLEFHIWTQNQENSYFFQVVDMLKLTVSPSYPGYETWVHHFEVETERQSGMSPSLIFLVEKSDSLH
jgi:hypothetical protein